LAREEVAAKARVAEDHESETLGEIGGGLAAAEPRILQDLTSNIASWMTCMRTQPWVEREKKKEEINKGQE
jgi:hypothetical protein